MKRLFIYIFILVSIKINAQDVQLTISKQSITDAVKTLIDARAASFSSYTSGFGVDMYNVRLFYSSSYPLSVTLIPNNRIRITCGVIGRANVDFIAGNFQINGEGSVTIEGEISASESGGELDLVVSTDAVINYSGGGLPGFLINIFTSNQFHVSLPDLYLTNFVKLPTVPLNYFETVTPTFNIASDNLIIGLQTKSVISGYVRDVFNTPISGTQLTFSNNGGIVTTDGNGYYKKILPHNWQGTVTPQKTGYTFSPSYKTYSPLSLSKPSESYEAIPSEYIVSTSKSILPGDYNITKNITVNNGATLTIESGATLKFGSGKSLIVNGVLNAIEATFTSISGTSSNSWGSIELNGTGASGSQIRQSEIKYGNQVRIINVPDFEILYNFFTNNYISIYVSGSNGDIGYNYLTSNSTGHSILIENGSVVDCSFNDITKVSPNQKRGSGIQYGGGSSGDVVRNKISYCDWGVGAIWGSSPISYWFSPGNKITNCNVGITVYRESYPVFGYSPGDMYSNHSIYDNTKNVSVGISYSTYASGLNAIGNWWGAYPPNTSLFSVGAASYFYYIQALENDPWSGLSKINSDLIIDNEDNNEIHNISFEKISDPLFEGIQLRKDKKFKEAKDFFKNYLEKYHDNQRAYVELYNCYNSETKKDIINYFKLLPKEASKDHKLLLSYLYHKEGDAQKAKKINDEIINENPNTSLAARAKINNLYITLYDENNITETIEIFNNVLTQKNGDLLNYKDLEDVKIAIDTYAAIYNKSIPEFTLNKNDNNVETDLPTEFLLFDNYPNPFNPNTIISYVLPVKANVKITIYDITGKLVKSYTNNSQSAGYQKIEWNGTNENGIKIASGVYMYRMEAIPLEGQSQSFVQSKKMMLLK